MSSDNSRLAMYLFVGVGLAMALGGGFLLNSLPAQSPLRAVGLALLAVGFVILLIWRIMRLFPRL